ncbi:hypothetical protein [Trinickia sp.]|uniref:hypothetical protein n=1 Tax=Trinickia sp. TaxID=2571163 RepID=UPI003F8033FA
MAFALGFGFGLALDAGRFGSQAPNDGSRVSCGIAARRGVFDAFAEPIRPVLPSNFRVPSWPPPDGSEAERPVAVLCRFEVSTDGRVSVNG